ncbi:hypothetical protein [Blastococcus sp. TF02A-30]|uniref:hypothetical protein n=1 Tax=Blastococcus sp. TF02A-30 TaxID=2250580 RepID=UPI001315005D|nr:hypothetical protein [Blastococcus sp. TF02A-30]
MQGRIEVQLDAVAALADELATLAREFDEDAADCRGAAERMAAALDGDEGATAAGVATSWASIAGAVAQHVATLAAVLRAAVAGYRELDRALAQQLGQPRRGAVAVAW